MIKSVVLFERGKQAWETVNVELRLFCNFWSDCPVSYLLLSVKLTRPAESAYMIVLPVSAEKEKWLEPVSLKREDPLVLWQALCGRLKHHQTCTLVCNKARLIYSETYYVSQESTESRHSQLVQRTLR